MNVLNAVQEQIFGKPKAEPPAPAPVPGPSTSPNPSWRNQNYLASRRTVGTRRRLSKAPLNRSRSAPDVMVTKPVVNRSPEPVVEPEPTSKPVVEPEPTSKPVVEPEPTSKPVVDRSPKPVAEPDPTPEPVVDNPPGSTEADSLPEATVTSHAGFDQLTVTLTGTQSVYMKAGTQLQMDESLELIATLGQQGMLAAAHRAMSTGTLVQNKIVPRAATDRGNVTLYTFLPGNIQELTVTGDDVWAIHHACYLASTDNVLVESNVSFAGFMSGNGLVYSKVRLADPTRGDGKVWLFAYGGVRTRPLDTAFRAHAGLFLAMKEPLYLTTAPTLASSHLASSAFSGMGILMAFQEAPDEVVHLQNGNLDALREFIQDQTPIPVAEVGAMALLDGLVAHAKN